MEKLRLNGDQPLNWSYDEEADVLYISFGDPRPSLAIDMGNVLVLEADGEMTGITIVNARRMLERKASRAPASAPK